MRHLKSSCPGALYPHDQVEAHDNRCRVLLPDLVPRMQLLIAFCIKSNSVDLVVLDGHVNMLI